MSALFINCLHLILVRKPEGRKPFGRPRNRREDSIKIPLKE
jgi:hypothetical protein